MMAILCPQIERQQVVPPLAVGTERKRQTWRTGAADGAALGYAESA
jgi:hypothetical protein